MEERDIRLLFQADHWGGALIVPLSETDGWQVLLQPKSPDEDLEVLSCKRGGTRVFKTSDSALAWCHQIGFGFVKVQLAPVEVQSNRSQRCLPMSNSILLIEDNPDEAQLAVHALKKNKVAEKIIVKHDGKEALDYLYSEHKDCSQLPSLVILDLGLPFLSGLEVLETIRSHEETKNLPVVILTTSEERTDIQRSYELGINSYVFKPTEFGKFNQVVEQLASYWSELNIFPAV